MWLSVTRVRNVISPSYGLLVNLPSVLQPYTSTLMQAVPYAFHSNALILITCAMIASSSLFVTTELSSRFPLSAYEKFNMSWETCYISEIVSRVQLKMAGLAALWQIELWPLNSFSTDVSIIFCFIDILASL